MRYPVTFIPGLPVAPDVGVGVRLTPVAPAPAPAPAPASGGGGGEMNAYWVFCPSSVADLEIVRGADTSNNNHAETTPPDAFIDFGDYFRKELFIVLAEVRDAPDSAVVTWDVDTPTVDYGTSPTVSPDGDGGFEVYFNGASHYSIRVMGRRVAAFYTWPQSIGYSYDAWALNPIALAASVDGVPLRELTLTPSALAFDGY